MLLLAGGGQRPSNTGRQQTPAPVTADTRLPGPVLAASKTNVRSVRFDDKCAGLNPPTSATIPMQSYSVQLSSAVEHFGRGTL